MNAGPGGGVFGQGAVIVAAGVVDVPVEVGRIEGLAAEPVGDGDAVESRVGRCGGTRHGDGELARGAGFGHAPLETAILFVIAARGGDLRLDAVLPFPVQEEPLLRREAEVALFPPPVGEHAQVGEQLANQQRLGARHRNVMRAPGERGNGVLAPARDASGLLLHFEQDEIAEAALLKTPGSR